MTREEIDNYIDDKKRYGNSKSAVKVLTVPDVAKLADKILEEAGILENTTCSWERSLDNIYELSCGEVFKLSNDDTVAENGFKFCPYCSGEIKVEEN